MRIKCYGKLNLALSITGKTKDNMHLLNMIMQSISIYDELNITKAKDLNVSCDTLKINEKNTAVMAAKLFFAHTGLQEGANIHLIKNIPTQAGLGGGSANGAGVLFGLNKVYNTNLPDETLQKIGLKIGADVPFFIKGGTMQAKGVGEKLTPITNNCNFEYLLIKPKGGVSTKLCYEGYNKASASIINIEKTIDALKEGNRGEYYKNTGNALQKSATQILPEIDEIIKDCYQNKGKFAMMTGSGSCVFAMFAKEDINSAYEYFKKSKPYVKRAVDTIAALLTLQ